jgi:hypothetical protein
MNTRPQLVFCFLQISLLFPGDATLFLTFGLTTDQLHAFEAQIDVIHHLFLAGKISDVLAMAASAGIRFHNT